MYKYTKTTHRNLLSISSQSDVYTDMLDYVSGEINNVLYENGNQFTTTTHQIIIFF